MITAGVDLASQALHTAACEIDWADGKADVTALKASGVDDDRIVHLATRAHKTGLDVPLGWPDAFVTAVCAHHSGRRWTGGEQRTLRFRVTDLHVWSATGRWPLSVSSDLIALPALRAAALMCRLPGSADRTGAGPIAEVYPAAALRRWGFPARGYKRAAGADRRGTLVPLFRERTENWLRLSDERWRLCELSDDAFDALIAALVARALHLGACDRVPEAQRAVIEREGWIALPHGDSLQELASG